MKIPMDVATYLYFVPPKINGGKPKTHYVSASVFTERKHKILMIRILSSLKSRTVCQFINEGNKQNGSNISDKTAKYSKCFGGKKIDP